MTSERRPFCRDPFVLILGVWVLFGLASSVRTVLRPAKHTVYPVYAASAAHWWADEPLYQEYPPLDRFRYPPIFAVAVSPLNLLGLCGGGVAWGWLNLLVYAAGLWRFGRDVVGGPWTRGRWALLFGLALIGASRGLWNGQSNALAIGLVLLGVAELARERWWGGAFLLAGSVAFKLTPLPIALLFCGLWPARLGGRFLLALVPFALAPFLTRPPEIVLEQYIGLAAHAFESGDLRWPGFRDAWTVIAVARHQFTGAGPFSIIDPIDADWYRYLQSGAGLAVFLFCLALRKRGLTGASLVQATLGLGCAWLMLFGPATEHATFAFLAPSLAAGFLDRDSWPGGKWLIVAGSVLVLLMGFGALWRPLEPYTPWVLTPLPVGTALFLLWQAGQAWGVEREVAAPAVPSRPWVVARGMQTRKRPSAGSVHAPRSTRHAPREEVTA